MFARILSVGGWTLGSRVTGFARDVVLAAIMGAGPVTDAFVVAFRLPNHFRAIFGEGAFNVAFIPSYGRILERDGEAAARLFAGRITALMLAIQVVLLALALAFMPAFVSALAPGLWATPGTYALAVELTRITFPYLLFITLATILSAILNAHERFWAAAAAPILLNVSMIATLALAPLFPSAGHAAAWGVAISGVLQFVLLLVATIRAGIAPPLARPVRDPETSGFFRRLGPAVLGSAGVQIALFADTIIGSALPAGALSALYFAERLYQLPLGVVGIAAGTVLLPTMSRLIAAGNVPAAHAAQDRAIGLSLALAAPCAVAFLLLPDLIMTALFQRGAFDSEAAARSGAVLAAYAVGLPAAVIVRSVGASFYARHDTATPLWSSLVGYGVNVALKVALFGPLGVVGLAIATSVGVWTNVAIAWVLAYRRGFTAPGRRLAVMVIGTALGSLAVAACVLALRAPIANGLAAAGPWRDLGTLVALALASGAAYAACFGLVGWGDKWLRSHGAA